MLLKISPFDGSGILDPPVCRHRLAGPDRTSFACGIVADGEHKIHDGGIRRREFCPALRAQADGRVVETLKDAQGERIRELTGQLRKATELLARSMNSVATMQRNLLRMDGEPVVGVPVAMGGNGNALEPMGFGLVAPNPTPAFPKGRETVAQTAEQRAIEAQQRRAKSQRS